jgi:hypothetical protein
MKLLIILFLYIIALIESRFNVENKNKLSGVYSNVCASNAKMSEQLATFTPNSHADEPGSREIIISSISEHGIAFGINMLSSLVSIGRLGDMEMVEFLFIVFDEATMEICDNFFIPCWLPVNILALENHTVANRFRHRMLAIPDVAERLLDLGAHVMYSDTDSVWLRSPYDALNSTTKNDMIQVCATSLYLKACCIAYCGAMLCHALCR